MTAMFSLAKTQKNNFGSAKASDVGVPQSGRLLDGLQASAAHIYEEENGLHASMPADLYVLYGRSGSPDHRVQPEHKENAHSRCPRAPKCSMHPCAQAIGLLRRLPPNTMALITSDCALSHRARRPRPSVARPRRATPPPPPAPPVRHPGLKLKMPA